MAKGGFALAKEVLDVVKHYVGQNSLSVTFRNSRPAFFLLKNWSYLKGSTF